MLFRHLFLLGLATAHVADVAFKRLEIVRVNEAFNDLLNLQDELRDMNVASFGPDSDTVAFVAGPQVLDFSSMAADAIDRATELADEGLARRQRAILTRALQEALDELDRSAAHFETEDDPLFESVAERLTSGS